MSLPERVYLGWRNSSESQLQLHESLRQGTPPERWLQEIWAHQRIRRDDLATSTGEPVRILHPGFLNREAGPDFLKAVVQRGRSAPTTGDIEIDLRPSGWKSHGHFQNPAYANVVLHVTWEPPGPEPLLPTLVLQNVLDSPMEDLRDWVDGPGDLPLPVGRRPVLDRHQVLPAGVDFRPPSAGRPCPTHHQGPGVRRAWPSRRLGPGPPRRRLPRAGLQTQRLAHATPRRGHPPPRTPSPGHPPTPRRLGSASPRPRGPPSARAQKRYPRPPPLGSLVAGTRRAQTLRPSPFLWRLHGVRPANHPQRRLALAAAWTADDAWESRIGAWFQDLVAGGPASESPETTLFEALRHETTGYWRRHYTLSARALPEPVPLLGAGRLNDLAVNGILPWLWARADSIEDASTRQRIESEYLRWPPGEDNATLKLARARIFGSDDLPVKKTAAVQQGLLQIVRDYCLHSDAICSDCALPKCFNQFLSSMAEGFVSRASGDGQQP